MPGQKRATLSAVAPTAPTTENAAPISGETPAPPQSPSPLGTQQPPPATAKIDVAPPPGTDVDTTVTHKWKAPAKAQAGQRATSGVAPYTGSYRGSSYAVSLEGTLSAFLSEWAEGSEGFVMWVIRNADPMQKRTPGKGFRRPCTSTEELDVIPFRAHPSEFISDVRALNGNSGGNFTIQLLDEYGVPITDAVWRGTIGDPPGEQDAPAAASGTSNKPRTLTQELKELNENLELLKNITGGNDKGEKGMTKDEAFLSMLKDSGAMAQLFSGFSTALSEVAKVSANAGGTKTGSVKEIVLTRVLDDEGLQQRAFGLADNLIDRVADLISGRRGRKREASNSTSVEHKEAPAANNEENSAESDNDTLDLIDYLALKCAANTAIDFHTDPALLSLKEADEKLYGNLYLGLTMLNTDIFIKKLVAIAEQQGKAAMLKTVLAMPLSRAWLEAFQQTAKAKAI